MTPTSISTLLGLAFAFFGFAGTIALSVFLGTQAFKPQPASAAVSLTSLRNSRKSRAVAFVLAILMSQNAFVASLLFSAFEWGQASWTVFGVRLLDFNFFDAGSAYAAHAFTPAAYLVWPALGMVAQLIMNKRSKGDIGLGGHAKA
jgi:hypothetical protein